MGLPITIIIPVYNRKGLVQKTLDTIPDEFTTIVVDNGSTDGTYEFLKTYVLNAHRKNMTIAREFTAGAAAARNAGLALCKTEWVYFFDSDDEFTDLPVKAIRPDLDMVCFPVIQEVNGHAMVRDFESVGTVHTHILNSMLNTVSMMFRTDWLREIGGWNESCRVWDDWELGCRALLHKPRLKWVIDKAYHRIIVHSDSITGPSFSARYKEILNTLNIVFEDIYEMSDRRNTDMLALFLRSYIFAGMLKREKNAQAVSDVHDFIASRFCVEKNSYRIGRLFEWYTGKGGPGAWRFALKLVDTLYHVK